ncbi:MAG: hypothetical protein AB7G37_17510 [Solirubrobacteraceae bacterium]
MRDRDERHDDLEPIRRLPIVREIGVELRGLAAEEDARAAGRSRRRPFTVLADAGGRALPTRTGRRFAGGLVTVVASAALAVGAAAATGLLDQGDPVPSASTYRTAPPASEDVLDLGAPDPDGGPGWGLLIYREHHGEATVTCAAPGRVQQGVIGVVGRDGVFNDDGRFHPLKPTSSSSSRCGGSRADGATFINGDAPPIPASGYTGEVRPDIGGCRENIPLRDVAPSLRDRLRDAPRCDPDSARHVKFGFAGPEAVRVEYGNDQVRRTMTPQREHSGAYLFVLRPDEVGSQRPTLTVTYSDGTVCADGPRPTTATTSRCMSPPGF